MGATFAEWCEHQGICEVSAATPPAVVHDLLLRRLMPGLAERWGHLRLACEQPLVGPEAARGAHKLSESAPLDGSPR